MDINKLKQLKNLNVELLETLIYAFHYIEIYCERKLIPIPSDGNLLNLFKNALSLIDEMNAVIALPPSWQHHNRIPPDMTKPSNESESSHPHKSLKLPAPFSATQTPKSYQNRPPQE